MENMFNWMGQNADTLVPVYIVASVIGLGLVWSIISKFFTGLNVVWLALTVVAKGLGRMFKRRERVAPEPAPEVDESLGYDIRIFDEDKDTVVEVSGDVATMTERVRRHEFFNRRYNRRIREATARLSRAYEARSALVTVTEGDCEWNPATQWMSADGKVTEVSELIDNHLTNVLKKIERNDDVGLGHRVLPLIHERLKAEAASRGLSG